MRKLRIPFACCLMVSAFPRFAEAQDQGRQLRRAIFAGHAAQIATLSASKTAVTSSDERGVTPLMIAAGLGQIQTVRVLLKSGASADAQQRRKG